MHFWRASYDPKTRGHQHSVSRGFGHALFAPIATSVFKVLRLSAAVWEHDQEWLPIHAEGSQFLFEFEHGREAERAFYNQSCLDRVQKEKRTVVGEFAGFVDLFVPIVRKKRVVGVLVVGSYLREAPSGAGILEHWRSLTGRQGRLSDPGFAAYLSYVLAVLVLDDEQAGALTRLLECMATLMAGEGRADELMNRIEALRAGLDEARFVDRIWELMREVLDDLSKRHPQSGSRGELLRDLGLKKAFDHVLVGLMVSGSGSTDPVDEAVRRRALQRRTVELARRTGHAVAGRVGDHGVVFLSGSGGSRDRQKQKLDGVVERAQRLATELALSLHFGVCAAEASTPVAQIYQAALGAAESALARRERLVVAKLASRASVRSLSSLRRELDTVISERPELFAARFERYLEAVAVDSGYRVEPARIHLEVGFERMTEALLRNGQLDEKSLRTLNEQLSRTTREMLRVSEIFAAYREALRDISQTVHAPAPAHRDRNLRSAIDYIDRNYATPLGRDQLARIAGFAPRYFSELFKRREGVTFEQYLSRTRLERAKQLLDGTDLEAKRVAELCGFQSAGYFNHAFRRAVGVTPLEFRRKHRKVPRAPGSPGLLSD